LDSKPSRETDAIDALLQIAELGSELIYFAEQRNTERYDIERMRYLAIERLLEMTGEALKRALAAEPELANAIPNINRIRGMRNRLAHEYDAIKFDIVWDAAEIHVPALVESISAILHERGAL
jgi:uncharacterized protein with HEPN domain